MTGPSTDRSYVPACSHGPIEEIASDVFMVRGSIQINALMRFTRNMAVIRHEGELTLINPIRMMPEGENQLLELGEVKRIMRLGAMHGIDDSYYVDTFGAEFWCQQGGTTHLQPAIDVELESGRSLPVPDAELFCFDGLLQPESALLLRRGKGLLLTCDAIQHYGDYDYCSWVARLVMPWIGFPKTTVIGPIWLKLMTPAGASVEKEFERLLQLEFDALLSAHGSLLASGAKQGVEQAFDRTFPKK